jgi:hypothetical protein
MSHHYKYVNKWYNIKLDFIRQNIRINWVITLLRVLCTFFIC